VFTLDCLRKSTCAESTTPFVDSLPVQWSRCYSSGTWTVPSHVSLFSGQDVVDHDCARTGDRLPPQRATLPRTANDHGYSTAIFSENPSFSARTGFHHEVDTVHDDIQSKLRFSEFSPSGYLTDPSPRTLLSLASGLLSRPRRASNALNTAYAAYRRFARADPSYPHHGRRVVSHLSTFLSEQSGPTLTVTNLLDPHNPYYGTPPGVENERTDEEREALRLAGTNLLYLLTDEDPPRAVREGYGDWERFYRAKAELYRLFAREADRVLQRWARDTAAFRDSLVVVLGDHGQLFGVDGMVGHHTSLHPHGIHVPLAVDPPADWDRSERSITAPVSIAGVGSALTAVAAGEITTTEQLVTAVGVDSRGPTGRVTACVDGPTLSLPPLYETSRFDDDRIDELAVRKVASIGPEHVDVYRCPWESTDIESASYTYGPDERSRTRDRETPPPPERAVPWLTRQHDPTAAAERQVDARLEALGYR